MDIGTWKLACIAHFQRGATPAEWEELATRMLYASEDGLLSAGLDEKINRIAEAAAHLEGGEA